MTIGGFYRHYAYDTATPVSYFGFTDPTALPRYRLPERHTKPMPCPSPGGLRGHQLSDCRPTHPPEPGLRYFTDDQKYESTTLVVRLREVISTRRAPVLTLNSRSPSNSISTRALPRLPERRFQLTESAVLRAGNRLDLRARHKNVVGGGSLQRRCGPFLQ